MKNTKCKNAFTDLGTRARLVYNSEGESKRAETQTGPVPESTQEEPRTPKEAKNKAKARGDDLIGKALKYNRSMRMGISENGIDIAVSDEIGTRNIAGTPLTFRPDTGSTKPESKEVLDAVDQVAKTVTRTLETIIGLKPDITSAEVQQELAAAINNMPEDILKLLGGKTLHFNYNTGYEDNRVELDFTLHKGEEDDVQKYGISNINVRVIQREAKGGSWKVTKRYLPTDL